MAKASDEHVSAADDARALRAAAFKAEMVRLIYEDGDVRSSLIAALAEWVRETAQRTLGEQVAAATKDVVRVHDLKPEAFRRPIFGIHV